MPANYLAIAGLVLNLIGVLLLFQFGLPTGIRTGGGEVIVNRATEAGKRRERLYKTLGFVGLGAIVIGTALQIWALV